MELLSNPAEWVFISILLIIIEPYVFVTVLASRYWTKAPTLKNFILIWISFLILDLTLPQHLGIYTLIFSLNSLVFLAARSKINLNKWYNELIIITLAIFIEYLFRTLLSQIALKQTISIFLSLKQSIIIYRILFTYLILILQSLYERYRT